MKPTTPAPDTTMDVLMDITRQAMQAHYADMLPAGFSIYKVAEYDPQAHTAPNLWLEKREKPAARYLAILMSDTKSVPALGETVSYAINAAIAKISALEVRQ